MKRSQNKKSRTRLSAQRLLAFKGFFEIWGTHSGVLPNLTFAQSFSQHGGTPTRRKARVITINPSRRTCKFGASELLLGERMKSTQMSALSVTTIDSAMHRTPYSLPIETTSLIPTNLLTTEAGSTSVTGSASSISDALLHVPGFWSVCIMLAIIGLLYAWEESVEIMRESLPKTIQPVLNKILGEIGGLGFIGLVLDTLVLNPQLPVNNWLGEISEMYLGDEEILLESFEFLHLVFFQTAVVFFATSALIITGIISQIEFTTALTEKEAAQKIDVEDVGGDSETSLPMEAYEAFLRIDNDRKGAELTMASSSSSPPPTKTSFFDTWKRELELTPEERGAEILVIRERLKREGLVDEGNKNDSDTSSRSKKFRILSYIEQSFASSKLDFVEISPSSWVPLIPGIALLNSIDLINDVLPNSANRFASAGYFVSTPSVIIPIAISQVLCLLWSAYNFTKMAKIKSMLVPKLVVSHAKSGDTAQQESNHNTNDNGSNKNNDSPTTYEILRPDVEVPELRKKFAQEDATEPWVRPIEQWYAREPTNRVQELFGTVGGNGQEFCLASIKFQLWLTVSSLMCSVFQILPRDFQVLLASPDAHIVPGRPECLFPELLVYGAFGILNLLELSIVPGTFLNYCLINTVETFVSQQEDGEIPMEETTTPVSAT